MTLPSGDQTGCVGSIVHGVMRVAGPPANGTTQSAPCAVNAMRCPSGDGVAAMLVPSWNSTVRSLTAPLRLLSCSIVSTPLLLSWPPPQAASIEVATAIAAQTGRRRVAGKRSRRL